MMCMPYPCMFDFKLGPFIGRNPPGIQFGEGPWFPVWKVVTVHKETKSYHPLFFDVVFFDDGGVQGVTYAGYYEDDCHKQISSFNREDAAKHFWSELNKSPRWGAFFGQIQLPIEFIQCLVKSDWIMLALHLSIRNLGRRYMYFSRAIVTPKYPRKEIKAEEADKILRRQKK